MTIGMVDDVARHALPDRHVHRVDDELGLEVVTHSPSDNPAAEGIEVDRQIQEARPGRHMGSLIDRPRSVSLSRVSATCKVLFEVIPCGASSRHPRRRNPECEVRDAIARM